jgi:anaphase-promoting complex subunit 2
LVSIYDTREVIFKELQVLLGTRLLAVKNYDAVKEVSSTCHFFKKLVLIIVCLKQIRTIELLKIRFGEAPLGVCDVMLKDMADSKRINDHVHGDIKVCLGGEMRINLIQAVLVERAPTGYK